MLFTCCAEILTMLDAVTTVTCSHENSVTNLLSSLALAGFCQILQFQLETWQYEALTQYTM